MDSNDIKNLINKDISALQKQNKETAHLFVEPLLCEFEDFCGNELNLWIILKKDEYMITFNQKNNRYGLAFTNIFNTQVFMGEYKSLSDTYDNLINQKE
ncbi:MAG TPA: hypothetical protein VHP36_05025 [Chitinispirillaceae bacterium]|nr:hypothetical protein [Chitinispirillaceae bacterium]